MDLLVEKGDSRTYLSRYKVITTSFEESSSSVKRNNTQIQYRNGNVDFGGWHEAKTIDYVGYYRADDLEDEEYLRERIYALLSDPDGYYITQLKNDNDDSFERPGETSGDYFDKQVNRPSHKRFYVYASSLESELIGSYGGHVLYKISATFTTMKLPYGESVPRDLDVKPNVHYIGKNIATGTSSDWKKVSVTSGWGKTYLSNPVYEIKDGETYTLQVEVRNMTNPIQLEIFGYNSADKWAVNLVPSKVINKDGKISITFTAHLPESYAYFRPDLAFTSQLTGAGSYEYRRFKIEKVSIATDWCPNQSDSEYNQWYIDTYYKTDNLVIPYAGTVTCSQLEQGFAIEFTAKEGGSNFRLNVNGTELMYNGQIYNGDVLKLSGYEYTKNDISVVKSTNKAYFKLLPGISNTISSNLHGSIKMLGFQDLYA